MPVYLPECIYRVYNQLHFRIAHHRTHRQAEFLCMYCFSDRKYQIIPFLITLLFMRRNRIMNNSLYAGFRQMLLQPVSLRTTNRENMEYMSIPIPHFRQSNQRIHNPINIATRNSSASLNILIQMP